MSWVSLRAFFRQAAQQGIGATVGTPCACAGDDADSWATTAVGTDTVGAIAKTVEPITEICQRPTVSMTL
ncbi:MAG: hypothetical protein OXP71_01255 [Candidatus Poribacteria bacterium]|nr:hypothetical protein [Candidatus Poribacteria bacterium]